jgi:hypothetical protein
MRPPNWMTHRKTLLSRPPLPQTETQITETTSRPVPTCPAATPHRGEPCCEPQMRTAVTKIDAALNLADHAIPPPPACWPANPQPGRDRYAVTG